MGFFYRAPGGGGANDPTYPSSPLTIAADSSETSFVLTNTGATPASVELSFSSLSGGQTLLIGQNYDQGTDTSPTYVIDPDDDTRAVTLTRGALAPNDPSSNEVVTLTSNAGVLPQTLTITVFKQSFMSETIRTFNSSTVVPTFEFNFEDLTQTGSVSTGDFTIFGDATVQASDEQAGFSGYMSNSGSSSRAYLYNGLTTAEGANFLRQSSSDRTWIYCWSQESATSGSVLIEASSYTTMFGLGYINVSGSTYRVAYTSTFDFDTSADHSDGGSSESLTTGASDLNVLAVNWDGSGNMRYYWKKTGDRAGYSYKDLTGVSAEGSWLNTQQLRITTNNLSRVKDLKWRYVAVLDYKITDSDFQSILSTAGL